MTPERINQLSPRERECLTLVAENFSSKEIARKLDLSPHTVNEYITSARVKLGASSRAEAARLLSTAERSNLTPPEEIGDDPRALVSTLDTIEESSPNRRRGLRHWQIPILRQGRRINDLAIFRRLLWIILGSVVIIILFAQLAQGMQVIESMLQGR